MGRTRPHRSRRYCKLFTASRPLKPHIPRSAIRTIAVIGANGQFGSEVMRAAPEAGFATRALRHSDVEVTDQESVRRALLGLRAGDVVVNTAALHKIEACEANPDRAIAVNAHGAAVVGRLADESHAQVVYISSDYVFDGGKRTPYTEEDAVNPINAYGRSKAEGEKLVRDINADHYVVRLSSVFGVAGSSGKGGNFVETMIAKARRHETIQVVNDIVMAPTYARDAARLLVKLIDRRAFGTYHLANDGECSWYEFADAILEAAGCAQRAVPISASEQTAAVKRPAYSVLGSRKLTALGLVRRHWKAGLRDYLAEKGYVQSATHQDRPAT